MTALRSVAAMPDDIRQSSIQHCSRDVEGNWWEWCTHANRNILRPRCCHCLPSSLSVSKQTTGETASSWLQWCHFAHNSAPECGHSDPAAVQNHCYIHQYTMSQGGLWCFEFWIWWWNYYWIIQVVNWEFSAALEEFWALNFTLVRCYSFSLKD